METDTEANLTSLLANEFFLYLKTLNYHWNIKGISFNTLHALLEEHYKQTQENLDQIAERLRALNLRAPVSLSEYQALAYIDEGNSELETDRMLADLVSAHEQLSEKLKEAILVAEQETDHPTAELLSTLLGTHQKNAWVLRMHLE